MAEKMPELGKEVPLPEEENNLNKIEMRTENGVERFSFAAGLISQMEEAENLPPLEYQTQEVEQAKDRQILNFVVNETLKGIKNNSEIRKLRNKVIEEKDINVLTKAERKKMVEAFDRSRNQAFDAAQKKFGQKLSAEHLKKIKKSTTSQLNYSLRRKIIDGGQPKAWMLLEPKLRKVHLMDRKTLTRYLRNSLNKSGDVKFIKKQQEDGLATENMNEALEEVDKDESLKKAA